MLKINIESTADFARSDRWQIRLSGRNMNVPLKIISEEGAGSAFISD